MNENALENPGDGLTPEQLAEYEAYMADHPEVVVPPESRRDCAEEMQQFNDLVEAFEAKHPIEELYGITVLAPADAPFHPTREPARVDLGPIVAKLNALKEETNISEDAFGDLELRYKRLSRAVGMISGGRVDHER